MGFSLKIIWQLKQVNPMFWMYVLEPALKYLESGLYRWYSHIVWIVSSVSILQIWVLSFSCLCCRIEVLVASWLKAIWNCQCKTSRPFIGILTNFVFSKLSNPLQNGCHHLFALAFCSMHSHCSCKWGQVGLFSLFHLSSKRTTLA